MVELPVGMAQSEHQPWADVIGVTDEACWRASERDQNDRKLVRPCPPWRADPGGDNQCMPAGFNCGLVTARRLISTRVNSGC